MTANTKPSFVEQQGRYRIPRFLLRQIIFRGLGLGILFKVTANGVNCVPPSGPGILMINHIASVDPAIPMGLIRNREIVPMSKVENLKVPIARFFIWAWGAYTVHRGEVDRTALQTTIDLLKAGYLVLMSPEGTRKPALSQAKDGMTYAAVKSNAAIIPVGVDGTIEFYANLRRLRRTPITAKIGRPFRFRVDPAAGDRVPRPQITKMTQEAMYQLAAVLPEHRRGYYSDLSQATTETLEFLDGVC